MMLCTWVGVKCLMKSATVRVAGEELAIVGYFQRSFEGRLSERIKGRSAGTCQTFRVMSVRWKRRRQ